MEAADRVTMVRWFNERGLICTAVPSLSGKFEFEPTVRMFGQPRLSDCRFGAYSYVAPNTVLNRTTVGRYCSIGAHCEISPTQHPNDWLTTSPIAYKDVFGAGAEFAPTAAYEELSSVTIGNDVWIGSGASIMGGVTIGDAAIIGYGSVVTRDVAPYHIVGGTPARMIRPRFDDTTIATLLASAWWRYDLVHMRGAALEWCRPLQALKEIESKAATGEVRLISSTLHEIRRSDANQFAFERRAKPK